MDMQFHIAAGIFPFMEGDAFDNLVEDIRAHGLLVPIKLLDGLILDGRNRYRACLLANVKPRFETVATDDPVSYVISLNKERRHLIPSQMAMVGARSKEVYSQLAKERQGSNQHKSKVENLPPSEIGKARDLAGKAVGVSGKSIDYASRVLEKGTPELIKAVDEGRMAVSTAAVLATEPAEVQKEEIANPKRNRVYTKENGKPKQKGSDGKPSVKVAASSAMSFASMAISQLERIAKDDPQRKDAFNKVLTWIERNGK